MKNSYGQPYDGMLKATIAQQQAKVRTYMLLRNQGLPIPSDLKQEIESSPPYLPPLQVYEDD